MNLFSFKKKKKQEETRSLDYITPYNESLLFNGYQSSYTAMNISAVYRAVEIISDSVAILPIKVKINNHSHKEELENHSLNMVLNENSLFSKYNLIKLLIQSVILKGNGFAFIERSEDGTVTNLRFLESNSV